MILEQSEDALNAFSRLIQQEPDDGEAWNNMASIYIRLGKKRDAYVALKEALRCAHENWKIWENLLFVSMDLGEFNSALHAIEIILEFKKENPVDTDILSLLADVVLKDIPDASGEPGKRYLSRLQQVLSKVTTVVSSNANIWNICARIEKVYGTKSMVVDYRQRQMRALQTLGWESEKIQFEKVVQGVKLLVESYLDEGSSQSLFSATLMVNGILKKTEKYFSDHSLYQELQNELKHIQGVEEQKSSL